MLQKTSSVFVVYRRKTLTGSPDPTHANGMDKPCNKPIDRDANMAAKVNKNSNHSSESTVSSEKNIGTAIKSPKRRYLSNNSNPITKLRQESNKKPDKNADMTAVNLSGINATVNEVDTELHQFVEDGEIIQMEINDGGAAAAEFSSHPASDNESDCESDEDGTDHYTADDTDVMEAEESPDEQPSSQGSITNVELLKTEQAKRKSMEEKLENMSNTLEVMWDFFMTSGMMQQKTGSSKPKRHQGGGDRGKDNTICSGSETTIYRNVLDRVCMPDEQVVDLEITFKLTTDKGKGQLDPNKRDSSSSEDQIDTSDELMDVDVELNDQFIPDDTPENRTCSRDRSKSRDSNDESGRARREADEVI